MDRATLLSAAQTAVRVLSNLDSGIDLRLLIIGGFAVRHYLPLPPAGTQDVDHDVDFLVDITNFTAAMQATYPNGPGEVAMQHLLQYPALFEDDRVPILSDSAVIHKATGARLQFHDVRKLPYIPQNAILPSPDGQLPFPPVEDVIILRIVSAPRGAAVNPRRDDAEAATILLTATYPVNTIVTLSALQQSVVRVALVDFARYSRYSLNWWRQRIERTHEDAQGAPGFREEQF